MNIKGLIPQAATLDMVRPVERINKSIKSDQSHDREPNGQQERPTEHKFKPRMGVDKVKKAIEHLESLAVAKEHKWTFEYEEIENKFFVIVKDNLGNSIRRIPEEDLWSLPDIEDPKGHLFKKAA
ncbi:MAG TPA: flagellar protein FlaG [Pseudobdellovibrionaceae bacterium]|nr:flagellar protein FlaG [Pseudobdellovibrionaceae bacterium]